MNNSNENNIEILKESISLIIIRHRGEKSLREFADDLNSKTYDPISYVTIKDWEDKKYLPRYRTILPIALQYDDWRRQFALEILKELKPEFYKPDQTNMNS